jgi:hypothetical protein
VSPGKPGWLRAIWHSIDSFLAGLFGLLKKTLRALNILRVLSVLFFVVSIALAVLVLVAPESVPYVLAGLLIVGTLPIIVLFVLLSIPFRAKSFVRLVRMGYPENAKELTIRLAARKMRDQSIKSEEMLIETAFNESRKLLERYRARLFRLKKHLDEMPADPDPAGGGMSGEQDGSGAAGPRGP